MTLKGSKISRTVSSEGGFPAQTPLLYFNLSLFWFALSFLWAGMITIVMQKLVAEMAGPKKDLYLGWCLGGGAFVSTIVCLVIGTMSDHSRWKMGKRRPYIIIGTLLSVPALLWLVSIRSLASIPLLILDFCLIQLWVNVATSPYQALMPDLVRKEHQGTASAYMGMSSLVGQVGGLVVCQVLLPMPNGFQLVMGILSAVMVLAMAYTVFRLPEHSAAGNPAPRESLWGLLVDSFRVNPREHPDFFRLIASRFVINMGFYTATEFMLYYVTDTLHAPDPDKTTIRIFLISTIAGLIGNFPAGVLSDRMSKKVVIYVSAATAGLAALIFLLTQSLSAAYAAAFIFGIGFGAFIAVDWAFATNLLPEHDEAKYMGVWHVAFTVPQVIAPLIGGLLAYYFNQEFGHGFGYRAVLALVVIYLALGTLMIRPIRERVIPH